MSLLELAGLTKRFGGVTAVDGLDVAIEAGRIHSIIGPNGAGKTTILNLITGVERPDRGQVLLDGADVTGLRSFERARRGVARTFQNLQVFLNMSALENVMAGCDRLSPVGLLAALARLPRVRRANRAATARALELIDFVGLAEWRDAAAAELPYGALKRLEIARALATGPTLLLLDEPAAGLNARETAAIRDLIQALARTGITVVLVEHDMRLVMGVSDHILVVDQGRRLMVGTAAEVRADPRVIQAYLGTAGAGVTGAA
ncbi:MAG: ABC transporter ATP-binding protein [Proteobacteria bacterium]|nr:ABC transporter ATP-binding protein [Pseudomonadota bacterium]